MHSFCISSPSRKTPPLLPSLHFTLTPPPLCKPPVQLPSGVSCWGLSDTGADLVNRKLSAKQGRWSWTACTTGLLGRAWSEWTWEWGKHSFPPGLHLPKQCHPVEKGKRGVQRTQGILLLTRDYIRGEVSMALASGWLQEGAVVSKEHRGRRGGEQTIFFCNWR